MKCPRCDETMAHGRAELRTRAAVRVLTGDHGSGARLYFVDAESGASSPAPLGLAAHRCGACDTVVLEGEGLEDALDCYECEAKIPADADACPACGWSW